jgi:spermidine/putrescine transport system substrate-binding protein
MMAETRQTRRQFILRAAGSSALLIAGGDLLAACGGGSSEATSAGGGGFVEPNGPAKLNFVGWQGYDAKPAKKYPFINNWMKQHQITLTSTYTQVNEEMLTKIQASPSGTYDLTSPYHGTVPTMIELGVLEPIQTDRMRNFAKIYDQISNLDYLRGADGQVYAVPLDFSYSVGLYNADAVKPLNSFADVIEDASLKRRYVLIDAPEHFTWIAQYLGFGDPDPHHLTKDELKKCQGVARKVVSNAKATPGSFGDILQLMLTHEADWSLSGNPSDEQAAQEKGVNIKVFLPKEGAQAYVDNYCIPKDSGNYDTALAWIDTVLSGKGNSEIQRAFGTGAVTPAAVPLLDKNLRTLYDYADIKSAFDKAPVWPPIPAKSDQFATYANWTKAWNEVK